MSEGKESFEELYQVRICYIFSKQFISLLLYRIPPDIQHMNGASVYVGLDPTADSLHIGNLVTIIALIHFQHNGYQPLAVVSVVSYIYVLLSVIKGGWSHWYYWRPKWTY